MNGIIEPLPGLLDDPQFQITDLPTLTDFQIAPLRNPAPSRHANAPSPLEPVTGNTINNIRNGRNNPQSNGIAEKRRTPKITPNDVLLAREAKKPHLAISELLEGSEGSDSVPTHLPSFVSLSVVEKSPTQTPSLLGQGFAQKRPWLDQDTDHLAHDLNRHLPRPAQKNGRQSRPAPLLPAIVTGLHEPPPSAALLPSMDVDARQVLVRTTTSKIQVKDILLNSETPISQPINGVVSSPVQQEMFITKEPLDPVETAGENVSCPIAEASFKDNKGRRARRKWTDEETKDLLNGVKKYGIGKWKHILDDPDFTFTERSSVDLKDRYRVCAKDEIVHNTLIVSPSSTSTIPVQFNNPVAISHIFPFPHHNQTDEMSPLVAAVNQRQRRKRRAWTAVEDASLLKGVTKYGFQWTVIHDDAELDLSHRRATDLRDRIRNRFPEGYKQAESAPLRSELRKAGKSSTATGIGQESAKLNIQLTQINSTPKSSHAIETGNVVNVNGSSTNNNLHAGGGSGGKMSLKLSDMMNLDNEGEREKEREKDQPGVTLPSFTLDDEDMDWDNRLPPVLLQWDEIGM